MTRFLHSFGEVAKSKSVTTRPQEPLPRVLFELINEGGSNVLNIYSLPLPERLKGDAECKHREHNSNLELLNLIWRHREKNTQGVWFWWLVSIWQNTHEGSAQRGTQLPSDFFSPSLFFGKKDKMYRKRSSR